MGKRAPEARLTSLTKSSQVLYIMDSELKQAEAPIDGTDEARALAAAAREAAKRKHDEVVKREESQPSGKKLKKAPAPRTKTSTHTVAVPDGFAPDVQRDEAVHGGLLAAAGYAATPLWHLQAAGNQLKQELWC